ncbi:MAG: UDP-N-acetylmuramoyl-L-alanine--D-glutamate ligase [Chitinophagales bacterium]
MSKKIVILGAGESGIGAAILAKTKGHQVFVSDKSSIAKKHKAVLQAENIDFEEKKHTPTRLFQADIVVKSPGIPNHIALIKELRAKNIPVISEIEWASRHTTANIIAITGSNGKTTTTSLVYHLLKSAGFNVGLAGNIGESFAKQVAQNNFDSYVLELSSFQLDDIVDFRPNIAIITNITPDHLDRYNYSLDEYAAAKLKITQNQTADDFLIYNFDDKYLGEQLQKQKIKAQKLGFSMQAICGNFGSFIEDNKIICKTKQNVYEIKQSFLRLKGKHNLYNTLAALTVCNLLDVKTFDIQAFLPTFAGLEHRLENVATIDEKTFINDSKATNIDSVWYAIDAMTQTTVWIVGGVDKGNDYSELYDLVQQKVKAIVCLGKENSKIKQVFADIVPNIVETQTANDAVRKAFYVAKRNETILLSPACASFDLFKNYIDRGNRFKDAVLTLKKEWTAKEK